MATKIGINGFGRIGRLVTRAALKNPAVEVVAVNDITDAKTLAYLMKYDSVHGQYAGEVHADGDSVVVDGKKIKVFAVKDPGEIPWQSLGAEVVVESTGLFTDKEKAAKHIHDSVKKVVISAPAKGEDLTIVMGVNEKMYDKSKHHVLSNASCTTNCLAPVTKVLLDNFGIVNGLMTTIHSYTNDQKILDQPHKDLRRTRAAALSMIPTTTGAAKAVGLVLPQVKGKLTGYAMRVPTPNVSVVDLTANLEKAATVEAINAAMKKASEGELKGILGYTEDPVVSVDFNGCGLSSIFDAQSTMVIDEKLIKVLSWYDNEWAYSSRVVDLVAYIAKQGL